MDIGSGANPWAIEWITDIVDDFVEPNDINKFKNTGIRVNKFDAQDSRKWDKVLSDVEKNGKYDFVICTHTLEDLNNPSIVCELINKIGKAGFISMPSKYAELVQFENKYGLPYVGYHHHRWIYQIKNNVLVGFPKMNFLDYVDFEFNKQESVHTEIAFLWKDSFDCEFILPDQLMDNRKSVDKINQLFEDDDLIL